MRCTTFGNEEQIGPGSGRKHRAWDKKPQAKRSKGITELVKRTKSLLSVRTLAPASRVHTSSRRLIWSLRLGLYAYLYFAALLNGITEELYLVGDSRRSIAITGMCLSRSPGSKSSERRLGMNSGSRSRGSFRRAPCQTSPWIISTETPEMPIEIAAGKTATTVVLVPYFPHNLSSGGSCSGITNVGVCHHHVSGELTVR